MATGVLRSWLPGPCPWIHLECYDSSRISACLGCPKSARIDVLTLGIPSLRFTEKPLRVYHLTPRAVCGYEPSYLICYWVWVARKGKRFHESPERNGEHLLQFARRG